MSPDTRPPILLASGKIGVGRIVGLQRVQDGPRRRFVERRDSTVHSLKRHHFRDDIRDWSGSVECPVLTVFDSLRTVDLLEQAS